MPRHPSAGSTLIYCLAVAAIAVVIGYSFLRSTTNEALAGHSTNRVLLARAAAKAGLTHATEQILAGYAATGLAVAANGGDVAWGALSYDPGRPFDNANQPPLPNFLDAPYRAPFVSRRLPDRTRLVDDFDPANDNDVRTEANLLWPMTSWRPADEATHWWAVNSSNTGVKTQQYGLSTYDGRGRYIEYNHHNLTRPSPTAPSAPPANVPATPNTPRPVDPVHVRHLAQTWAPERSDGLFLDENLLPAPGADSSERRRHARYRLRYAVGVYDLSGQILSNPTPGMDVDPDNPANDYRQPKGFMRSAQHAFFNLTAMFPGLAQSGGSPQYGRIFASPYYHEHIFLGRGTRSNHDRQPVTGYPVTFPMMFRSTVDPERQHGNFTDGIGANEQYDPARTYAALYQNPGVTTANPNGGEYLWDFDWDNYDNGRWIATLFGPQLSWGNYWASMMGSMGAGHNKAGTYVVGGTELDGGYHLNANQAHLLHLSPFGRGLTHVPLNDVDFSTYQPAWNERPLRTSRGEQGLDCPWLVNLLTASPQTVRSMFYAYMPARVAGRKACTEQFFVMKPDPSDPSKLIKDGPAVYAWTGIGSTPGMPGRDLFTELAGPAFSEYCPPPLRGSAYPDFNIKDVRPAQDAYPGLLVNRRLNETSATAGRGGEDDLGLAITASTVLVNANCSHTSAALLIASQSATKTGTNGGGGYYCPDMVALQNAKTAGGIPWLDPGPLVVSDDPNTWERVQDIDPSYWRDIEAAFMATVAFARAVWVQYPNASINPAMAFTPASLRDPRGMDSLVEVDRLFLRQLGEDFDAPDADTVTVAGPLLQNTIKEQATTAAITWSVGAAYTQKIRTLVLADLLTATILDHTGTSTVATSAERGRVMERMLNDFRMSFLGDSPGYHDFRPLDFDGDGSVCSSAYPSNPSASQRERDFSLDRYLAVDAAFTSPDGVVRSGRGPRPLNWFSLTGAFFIGRSHVYRVITRGELYDNVLRVVAASETLDSVLVVDPELRPAVHLPSGAVLPAVSQPRQSHALYQRWHYSSYGGDASQRQDW